MRAKHLRRWVLAPLLVLATGFPFGQVPAARATFPGNDGLIVFVSNRDGDSEIFTMTSAGASQTQLTFNSVPDGDPKWSANGAKIVFDESISSHNEIMTMNANGTGLAQVTHFGADSWGPSWSPDGKKIVFVSNKAGSYDLYTIHPNGSHLTRLFHKSGSEEWPNYSPNGRKILFDSNAVGGYELWTANSDGTHLQRLTSNPRNVESNWGPTGKLITFESSRPNDTSAFQLYQANANGSGATQLVVDPTYAYWGPDLSPSGAKIVYYTALGSDDEVWTINANGSGPVQLTNNSSADFSPNWQPT